jgi:cytochrome c553
MKKTTLLLLLCVSVLFAEDYSVTLKAKGQFGQDLKALIEKYKKSGNIEVVETKPTKKETIKEQIANFFSDQKSEESYRKMLSRTSEGKRIYNLKCASCHGKSGEDSSYGGKPLNKMSLKEYLFDMDAYGNTDSDEEASSHQSFVMTQYANTVTNEQNIGIYQYLQNLKNPKNTTSNNRKNSNKKNEMQKESSSYLQ